MVISKLPEQQRPDPDKRLVPWIENGTGEVHVARISDEWKEAEWIAERILELHDERRASGRTSPCSADRAGCSSRCSRRSREHEIPVEILGLAGLLRLPEIVEVLAYARAVSDPLASVALARILLGPRYRVGYKDLARVAALAKMKSYALRLEDEEEGEATPFLFAEALEHLDEVERLSDDGARAARGVPARAGGAARRGAQARRRVPGGDRPTHGDPGGAGRAHRSGRGDRRQAQPRGVHGPGARVRAGRGRAHAPRVPGLRGHGRADGQAGVVAGAARRRRTPSRS